MRYLAARNVTDGSEVTMQTLRHLDAPLWSGAAQAGGQTAVPFEATVGERILLVPEAAIRPAAGIPACAARRAPADHCHG